MYVRPFSFSVAGPSNRPELTTLAFYQGSLWELVYDGADEPVLLGTVNSGERYIARMYRAIVRANASCHGGAESQRRAISTMRREGDVTTVLTAEGTWTAKRPQETTGPAEALFCNSVPGLFVEELLVMNPPNTARGKLFRDVFNVNPLNRAPFENNAADLAYVTQTVQEGFEDLDAAGDITVRDAYQWASVLERFGELDPSSALFHKERLSAAVEDARRTEFGNDLVYDARYWLWVANTSIPFTPMPEDHRCFV